MKVLFYILFLFAFLCSPAVYGQLPGYYFYKTLTIQSSQVAGAGSHANFPILISETDADLAHLSFGGDVQNINGYDIAFTAADGTTVLDHQIEEYDQTTGELDAWVKIPALSGTVNTEIRMYYGNAQVTTDPSTDNVWDANFAAVYHLTDDFLDKTNNNNNLSNNGTSNVGNAQVAKGRSFNSSDYLEAPNSGSIAIGGNVTISTWVDPTTIQAGAFDNALIGFGGPLDILLDNHLYYLNIRDDNRLTMLWEYGLGLDEIVTSTNAITIPASGFTMLSATRNTTTNEVTFYQDGVALDVSPTSYTNDPAGGTLGVLRLGQNQQLTTLDFEGDQDEVRISNNVRSDDWMLTEFNTINDPATFYTTGPEIKMFGIWDWIDEGETVNEEWGNDVAVDTINQFVYTAGTMTDRNAFGIPAGKLNDGSDNGNKDGFLAKHDFNGNLIWVVNMGGNLADEATGVAIDQLGNPYVVGYYTNYIAAHSSDLSQDTPGGAEGGEDVFIAKYSPAGILDWIIGEGGSGNDRAHAVDINSGAIYVTGVYQNSAGFGSLTTENTNNSVRNTFLSKHKLIDGDAEWLMEVKSEGQDFHTTQTIQNSCMDVASINDTLYVVGYMGGTSLRFVEGDGTLLGSPILTDANTLGKDIFIYAADTSGTLIWAQKIDNIDSPNQLGLGISADCDGIYVAGMIHDGAIFPGPDVVGSTFHDKMFISKFQHGDGTEVWLKEFDNSPTNHVDLFHDIKADGYGNLFICGTALDAISNTDTSLAATTEQSAVIFKYGNDGTFQWAEQSTGSGNDIPYAIDTYRKDNVFMTGEYTDNFQLASVIVPATTNDRNYFLTKMTTLGNGTKLACCPPPSFDVCQGDTTVTADPSCNHTLADYTLLVSATDNCGGGLTYTQTPSATTVLTSGTHEISIFVEDIEGNLDSCKFDLIIEADIDPIVVECGDAFLNQTTGGGGNTSSSFSCAGVSTPGQDVYYQITVPTGNHFLYINIDNVVDANDDTLNAFWVGSNCPLGASCLESYSYDISNQEFATNSSNTESVLAVGPGTYYFVIDSKVDSIQSYDISFNCLTSGIEYDTTDCSGNDSNNDGLVPSVNASTVVLDLKPCETVNICHDLYINNVNDFEWMDSVEMKLGPCYENINTATLTPDLPTLNTGFYDTNGEWDGSYTAGTNTIMWEFDHSSVNPWGDGNSGSYTCNKYTFCFDADITAGCLDVDSTKIVIGVWDDAIPVGITIGGFDSEISNDFTLLPPDDDGWSYASTSFCQGAANPSPTISGTTGGSFSSTVGLAWADQPNGIINLAGSTPGNYDITYSVGACPTDSIIPITITAEDDPFFDYSSNTFCADDADPSPTNVATAGGTYSSTAGLAWADQPNGIIDLDASTPNNYTITYLTAGICPNTATFNITITAEEDPFFDYPASDYCAGDSDPTPTNIATAGGSFTSTAGLAWANQTNGIIDLDGSTPNTYIITYLTTGSCPNSATFEITINAEDDATFTYSANTYCSNDDNQLATVTGTAGGVFNIPFGGLNLVSSITGELDISASNIGGPFTVEYTTPGLACPNTSTFLISIDTVDDATFNYSAEDFCANGGDEAPTFMASPGGAFTSAPAGLNINSASGIVDVSASSVGDYVIYYTTNGICPNIDSVEFDINPIAVSFFNYPQNQYCSNGNDPTATNVLTGGGTFTSDAGVVWINQSNGTVDLDASTAGAHTITYTTTGSACPSSTDFTLTILPKDDATFDYLQSVYCAYPSATDPIATNVVLPGGTFSGPIEVIFLDNTTGEIDLDASTAGGPYTIQYLSNGPCPDSTTFELSITAPDNASFDYPQSVYCANETNPNASNVITSGGTFSGPTGIIFIDNNTGEIDLDSSTPGGPYSIQYLTNGNCPDSTTFDITINPQDDAAFSITTTDFCTYSLNEIPGIDGTTGGSFSSTTGLSIVDVATGEIDFTSSAEGSHDLTYSTNGALCPTDSTITITINPATDPAFSYAESQICLSGDNPIPTTVSSGGTFSSLSSGVILLGTEGEIDLDNSIAGSHEIQYISSGFCTDTSSILIELVLPIIAFAGLDQNLDFVTESVLEGSSNENAFGQWTSANSSIVFSDDTDSASTVSNLALGENVLSWTIDDQICPSSTDEVRLLIFDIFIPEALTPNGDGDNDIFEIYGIDSKENTVEIYNRWGQVVYKVANYQNDWDGDDMSGNQLKNDTYFCIITVADRTFKGYVVLKRE